jgi:hypothetical protein
MLAFSAFGVNGKKDDLTNRVQQSAWFILGPVDIIHAV